MNAMSLRQRPRLRSTRFASSRPTTEVVSHKSRKSDAPPRCEASVLRSRWGPRLPPPRHRVRCVAHRRFVVPRLTRLGRCGGRWVRRVSRRRRACVCPRAMRRVAGRKRAERVARSRVTASASPDLHRVARFLARTVLCGTEVHREGGVSRVQCANRVPLDAPPHEPPRRRESLPLGATELAAARDQCVTCHYGRPIPPCGPRAGAVEAVVGDGCSHMPCAKPDPPPAGLSRTSCAAHAATECLRAHVVPRGAHLGDKKDHFQ